MKNNNNNNNNNNNDRKETWGGRKMEIYSNNKIIEPNFFSLSFFFLLFCFVEKN